MPALALSASKPMLAREIGYKATVGKQPLLTKLAFLPVLFWCSDKQGYMAKPLTEVMTDL